MKFIKSLLALALFLVCVDIQAQTYKTPDAVTNLVLPPGIAANGISNVNSGTLASQPVIINPGYGVGFSAKWFNNLTTATTNEGFFINVSPDGSNWFNPAPYYFELKHIANTTNWVGTNLPAAWFDGFMQMRLEAVTNCDNVNATTNVIEISRKRLDY